MTSRRGFLLGLGAARRLFFTEIVGEHRMLYIVYECAAKSVMFEGTQVLSKCSRQS